MHARPTSPTSRPHTEPPARFCSPQRSATDNYSSHQHPKVKIGLTRHPRFHRHFIPTSRSWLHMIERWFRQITTKRIRRGVFPRVEVLEKAIHDYINTHNQDPRSFVWTADLPDILPKTVRAHETLKL